jgi:hypothetical protein
MILQGFCRMRSYDFAGSEAMILHGPARNEIRGWIHSICALQFLLGFWSLLVNQTYEPAADQCARLHSWYWTVEPVSGRNCRKSCHRKAVSWRSATILCENESARRRSFCFDLGRFPRCCLMARSAQHFFGPTDLQGPLL